MSPLMQRNPVFGQLSLSEEALKVPSWWRVWKIRHNFLHWGAFLLRRVTQYLSGIWNEHSLPLANSTPWNTSGSHGTTDGPKCPCPIFPLTPLNGGFLPFVLYQVCYLVGWLVWVRHTLFSSLIYMHTQICRMGSASISAGVCSYSLSLSPGSVLLWELFRVHRWGKQNAFALFISHRKSLSSVTRTLHSVWDLVWSRMNVFICMYSYR